RDLPALMKSYKLQKKAAKVGFNWDSIEGVFDKLDEEVAELKEAVREGHSMEAQLLELGDVLFVAVNAARFMDVDPEEALSATNRKFVSRFQYIEQKLREQGRRPEDSSVDEMETYWQEAKKLLDRD
ncbi:MazG nucleotide pyrophosphohydrolase domain-containing protein, partial [Paenibacillus polymyxa]